MVAVSHRFDFLLSWHGTGGLVPRIGTRYRLCLSVCFKSGCGGLQMAFFCASAAHVPLSTLRCDS